MPGSPFSTGCQAAVGGVAVIDAVTVTIPNPFAPWARVDVDAGVVTIEADAAAIRQSADIAGQLILAHARDLDIGGLASEVK